MATSEDEIRGQLLQVVVVKEDLDGNENATVLSLVTADDVSLSVDEDMEDENLANRRRTKRVRTHNTVDFEFSSLIATDVSALKELNIVDEDGDLIFDNSRRLNEDESLEDDEEYYLDIQYLKNEGEDPDVEHEHRLHDVEVTGIDYDLGETPPVSGFDVAVHGKVEMDATTDYQ